MTQLHLPTAGQRNAGRPSAFPDATRAARASTRTLQTARDAGGQVTSVVRRTQLPSGLRIITEQMTGARSAAVGVWVGVGSRDERASTHGASHFLEHVLFKGTRERSALDISIALDAVGGEFNAFTAKEYTCFHARVLGEDLGLAADVLGDMITDSLITSHDVDAERDVILDEIAMHEDDPDDVVHNLFAEIAWGAESPLGRPIAGTVASIEAMPRETIKRFWRRHYTPSNMVVSAAGAVDHDVVVRMVKRAFGRRDFLTGQAEPVGPRTSTRRPQVAAAAAHLTRPFEQVNLVVGSEGPARDDVDRFAFGVVSTALGGGTSSRLFQEVREQRGLAYSVYSFASHYADSGLSGVALGCLPGRAEEALAVVRSELARLAAHGIDADELRRGKGQLTGGLVLGLEDAGARMMRIGKGELTHTQLYGIDEVIAKIDAVTLDDCARVAAEVFSRPEILAVVGP